MATVEELQSRIQDFIQKNTLTKYGSISKCIEYLVEVHNIVNLADDPLAELHKLYNAKRRLHAQCQSRYLTLPLAECLFEVEIITHFALDIIKSHESFTPESPRLEFRMDWRELCDRKMDPTPLYHTQYGFKEWVRAKLEK